MQCCATWHQTLVQTDLMTAPAELFPSDGASVTPYSPTLVSQAKAASWAAQCSLAHPLCQLGPIFHRLYIFFSLRCGLDTETYRSWQTELPSRPGCTPLEFAAISLVQAGTFRFLDSEQLGSWCVEDWKVILKHIQLQQQRGQHTQQSSRLLDRVVQEVKAEMQSHKAWSVQLKRALTRCLLSLMQLLEPYRSCTETSGPHAAAQLACAAV